MSGAGRVAGSRTALEAGWDGPLGGVECFPGLFEQGEIAVFCSSGLPEAWPEPEAPGPTVPPLDPRGPQPPLQFPAALPHPPHPSPPRGRLQWQLLLTDAPASCGIRHRGLGVGVSTEGSESSSGARGGPSPGSGLELCAPREGSQCGLPRPESGCLPGTPTPPGTSSGTGCQVKPTLALGVC